MASYSANTTIPTNANIQSVAAQVDEVKLQMQRNVQLVMDRGENLDTLERKTERLEETGSVFQKSTRQAKSLFRFKNRKWTLFLIIFIVLLVLLIALAIYLNVRN